MKRAERIALTLWTVAWLIVGAYAILWRVCQ